ncbi:MAG: RluA family pseudouridine synthase [Candidatus Zambryskibacteria bacterium]|nr:RluA family pseudouridine synthase [Candidatus Zambryskibacteria bacterium]
MKINIIYEDEYILVLDKPAGLLVHSDGRSKEKTLVDWINENYPTLSEVGELQKLQNGEKIKRPGIVHRLDKETSGVIIVAKTKESFEFLKEQFKNHKIQKIYNAIVWGNFSPDKLEGVINKPIGRSASDFRKWSAEFGSKGELREAVTEYKVLNQNKDFAYLEVRPKTGRTHQIRVHLKSISHPVVCDKLYGSTSHRASRNKRQFVCDGSKNCLGFNRLALHALSIKLELPNKTHLNIESPLPPEFQKAKTLLSDLSFI